MGFAKSAATAGVAFAVPMTFVFMAQMPPTTALIAGVVSGALFGPAISAFTAYQRKRMMLTGPLDGERIVHQGPANHMRGMEARGGWLVLTERALVFRSHGMNVQNAPLRIPLADLREVTPRRTMGVVPNGLLVTRADGTEEKFVVGDRAEWLRLLATPNRAAA